MVASERFLILLAVSCFLWDSGLGAPKKDKPRTAPKIKVSAPKIKINIGSGGSAITPPRVPPVIVIAPPISRTPTTTTAAPPKLHLTCEISIPSNLSTEYEPILIYENSSHEYKRLMPSVNGTITRKVDTRVIVSCPNSTIAGSSSYQSLRARCLSSGKWKVSTMPGARDIQEVHCQSPVEPSVQWVDKKCQKGTFLEFGFQAMGDFVASFRACHDAELAATRFTVHKLMGAQLHYQRNTSLPEKLKSGLRTIYKEIDLEMAHSQENVKEILEKAYSENATKYLSNCSSEGCITPLLLSPRNDFVFGTDMNATHFWANTVPAWTSIYKGNWAKMENDVREFSKKSNKTLRIFTGSKDVLKLPGADEDVEIMYLAKNGSENRLPVPAYLWKLVVDEHTKSCIGFITVNNPFSEGSTEKVCDDVCEKSKWPEYKGNYTEGHIHCCDGQQMNNFIDINSSGCTELLNHE